MTHTRRTVDAEKNQEILKLVIEVNNTVKSLWSMDKSGDHPLFDKRAVHLRVHSDLDFANKKLIQIIDLLQSTPPIEATAGSVTVEMAKDEVARKYYQSNEEMYCVSWRDFSLHYAYNTELYQEAVNEAIALYASSQSKRIEELEREIIELKIESTDISNCLWHMTKKAEKLQSELSESRKEIENYKYLSTKLK